MAVIVSDTTALIILAKTNHLELLTNLVEKVYIPQAVINEIHYKNDIVKFLIERSEFIEIREVTDKEILNDIQETNLDLGETEAIALALELNFRLLIDEKSGRKVAKKKGVKIIGLLGILEANYQLNFIRYRELLYILDEFKSVGYRLSSQLERGFLEGLEK